MYETHSSKVSNKKEELKLLPLYNNIYTKHFSVCDLSCRLDTCCIQVNRLFYQIGFCGFVPNTSGVLEFNLL